MYPMSVCTHILCTPCLHCTIPQTSMFGVLCNADMGYINVVQCRHGVHKLLCNADMGYIPCCALNSGFLALNLPRSPISAHVIDYPMSAFWVGCIPQGCHQQTKQVPIIVWDAVSVCGVDMGCIPQGCPSSDTKGAPLVSLSIRHQ
jgi:hypothetical protein